MKILSIITSYSKMFNLEEIIFMHPEEKYVTIDKDIGGGVPVFKGTRVTVKTLFDYLEENSLDEFLEGHPSVSRE